MTRKQIPLRLPVALVERIDAWAEAEKIGSRNAAIERALDLVLPGGKAEASMPGAWESDTTIPTRGDWNVEGHPSRKLKGFDPKTGEPIYG